MTGFKTIDETIESVVRQGCSKCEILILRNDIQSLPQGTDVAEKNVSYLDSDYLLREIFIREKGKGNALNEGILRAKNNLICELDADCILKENALSQAVRHFENEDVVAVGGGIVRTYILGNLFGYSDIQEDGSVFFGDVCRICFGANRTDDICGVHRYGEK